MVIILCLMALISTNPLQSYVTHTFGYHQRKSHQWSSLQPHKRNTSPRFSQPALDINSDDGNEKTRSTSDPDYEGGAYGNESAKGRDERRARLHDELTKLGIDPDQIQFHPDQFGTPALRTYNSFIFPKSAGALAVAESPTRARVVANSMSFLIREYKADQELWLRNVDQKHNATKNNTKHSITVILDNVRSAPNVGNILRLSEAAQVESVRLCGMTPRPPHPKVLKTAMGSAEFVSLGEDEDQICTLQTVRDLKARGVRVYGVETTENSTTLWDTVMPSENIAFVFGNELIGVDVDVLKECDGIVSLPTYGVKNSLNIANCVSIVLWDTLRRWRGRDTI